MRARLRSEDGFAALIALGVLTVTALLLAAVWIAVGGDTHLSQHDLDGKRALYAANAGVNAFLYQLNQNPATYWQTCTNDTQTTPTPLPGATNGEQYTYALLPANGNAQCVSTNPTSVIDVNTGSFRIEFTGYAGTPQVKRTLVVSFRESNPFDFLWYTVYEQEDTAIAGTNCATFYRNGNLNNPYCNVAWYSTDVVNGPMYTEDQFNTASYTPTFGRSASDHIESMAPGSSAGAICANNTCGGATIRGTPVWNAPQISPPPDNSLLAADAANHGKVYTGTTSITLNGSANSATVVNCPSSCTTSTVSLAQTPIIYVQNGSGCTPYTYDATRATYSTTGCVGDVYIQGSYNSSLTVAAANNVIINGNLSTSEDGSGHPTGGATLGLVANEFVRVMHGSSSDGCGNGQTFSSLKIDAAILALQHSFLVDNFTCGNPLGTLTVNGAIAQYFRGPVGQGAPQLAHGYSKSYAYDDRLKYLLPPYLFDIANASWHITRETSCTPGANSQTDPTAC